MNGSVAASLRNWLPYRTVFDGGDVLFRWIYTGGKPYTEPFFEDTVRKYLGLPVNSNYHKCASSADMLIEWGEAMERIIPAALVFHVSRCGSTLVSQALGLHPACISLSEVPVFDDMLRLPYKYGHLEDRVNDLLSVAINFYAAEQGKKVFIKTDSWHLMFYRRLRSLFPHTPFIIIYRDPVEVLRSHTRKNGTQSAYGAIEPGIFGLQDIPDEAKYPGVFMAHILVKYFEQIIEIGKSDDQALLLNYSEGILAMIRKIAAFTGIALTPEYEAVVTERALYDAKYPGLRFEEPPAVKQVNNAVISNLMHLYDQTDELSRMKL